MATKSALQKILKGILQTEGEDKLSHENMGINKSYQVSRSKDTEWQAGLKSKN
jgi:hypothetical protein